MNFEERCNEMVTVVSENIKCSAAEIRRILAGEFFLYDRDVSAVFRLITGEELSKCIINYKLLGIQKMKLETGCTWDAASKEYGYEEYVTFYRNCTERTGMSPDELFESGIMFEPDAIGKAVEYIDKDSRVDVEPFEKFQSILIDEICMESGLSKERVMSDLNVYLSKCINSGAYAFENVALSDELDEAGKERLNGLLRAFEGNEIEITDGRAMIEDEYIYFNYGEVGIACHEIDDGFETDWYPECYPVSPDESIDAYLVTLGFTVYDKNKYIEDNALYYRFRGKSSYPVIAFIKKYAGLIWIDEPYEGWISDRTIMDISSDISDSFLEWMADEEKVFAVGRKYYDLKAVQNALAVKRENERKRKAEEEIENEKGRHRMELYSYLRENGIELENARAMICDEGVYFSYGKDGEYDENLDRMLKDAFGFEIIENGEYRFKGKRWSYVWYFLWEYAADSIIDNRSWRK